MPAQTNTGEAHTDCGRDTFIRPLLSTNAETDEARATIGGKGRSIARLRALGLPTPPAFVVSSALWTALRESSGAPLPTTLATLADWDLLEAARADMLTIAFPKGFADALAHGLEALAAETREVSGGLGPSHPTLLFAVRSSSATEDHAHALAPGVFESELRVTADDVPNAIRRILSSALSPGAWAYAAHTTSEPAAPLDTRMAVLVHPFVPGTCVGIGACDPANGEAWVSITEGTLLPEARAQVVAALQRASGEGPVEIEWVAEGDKVTFLQLRPYVAGPRVPQPDASTKILAASATNVAPAPPWQWDAAHNPAPLSPAHVGLVEWVDECCEIGIRQRVVDGYLFWKPRDGRPLTIEAAEESPRVAFDHLVVETTRQIDALGSEPSLEAALNVFASAYQTLFGAIAPACARARARFEQMAAVHFARGDLPIATWLAGIPSAATRRAEAAKAIATAASLAERQACVANYLAAFGDESARWDVAEPTWRERPEPLFRLAGLARVRAARINNEAPPAAFVVASPATATTHRESSHPELADRDACVACVPATERPAFQSALNAARDAAAIAEDDDAFYARLQALVRRALLVVGRRLHDAERVIDPDDVFYLPLAHTRQLARAAIDDATTPDLKATVARARAELHAAASRPPLTARARSIAGHNEGNTNEGSARGVPPRVLRGQGGAPGRTIGRAVHHPAAEPLTGNAILIASTLLPTELPLVFPAAIVAETGSPLGHVAAQARERGIPAVVGVASALSLIPSGALILVDGSRGEITRLDRDAFDDA